MPEVRIGLSRREARELKDLTGAGDFQEAVELSVKFTLMHDKDSVQGALKQ